MAQPRGKLIDELTDDVTRTALRSANLSAEDRVLAAQRVRQAVIADVMSAHASVVDAAVHGMDSPEGEDFGAYVVSDPRLHLKWDAARPEAGSARTLAAELLAADDRTNTLDAKHTGHAVNYIAHAAMFAADAEARKVPGGPSQAPAVAAGAAAAAGAVAAPVVAVKAGVQATRSAAPERRGPSIG